jgi:hypothetical protein
VLEASFIIGICDGIWAVILLFYGWYIDMQMISVTR